ncbi:hypothetical protein KEM52_006732 [Ascosphaera acerosa]|nr:hypothetical protein KEM52_006732 [Ascosphaera acerosa]
MRASKLLSPAAGTPTSTAVTAGTGTAMTTRSFTSPRGIDSPSRQLMAELSAELEQMRIQSFEMKLVKAHERRAYYESLDQFEKSREASYNSAHDAADAAKEVVRRGAMEVLEKHMLKLEEKRRKEEERKREKEEKARRKEEERRRKQQEEEERQKARQREERRKQEEQEKRLREEEERKRRQEEEAKKKQQAAEEIKRRKEKEAQEKAATQAKKEEEAKQTTTPTATSTVPLGATRRSPEELQLHERYLQIHQKLKEFRKWMAEQAKLDANLKKLMGEGRRTIKKCTGQLVPEDKKANKTPTQQVASILANALTVPAPTVDIRDFIAVPSPAVLSASTTQVPALFIYLLNMFTKAVIAQLIAEASVKPKTAEPLGIYVAQILSAEGLCFQGTSMMDVLLAKYHVVCPVLFGFYGPEDTAAGKEALGWWREEGRARGSFVPRQQHEERMIGLASGFAALALRNFSKAKRRNPLPNAHFWAAVAHVLEPPPAEVQDTHLYVLNALLRHSAPRVVGFWGDYGWQLLRYATVDFLAGIPGKEHATARNTVDLLRLTWANEKGIFIA